LEFVFFLTMIRFWLMDAKEQVSGGWKEIHAAMV